MILLGELLSICRVCVQELSIFSITSFTIQHHLNQGMIMERSGYVQPLGFSYVVFFKMSITGLNLTDLHVLCHPTFISILCCSEIDSCAYGS